MQVNRVPTGSLLARNELVPPNALMGLDSPHDFALCERCHTSDPTVRRHLKALKALGLVRQEPAEGDGVSPGRPARRFRLDAEAATSLRALFDLLSEPLAPTLEPVPPPLPAR